MNIGELFGYLSGVLHLLGYYLYISRVLSKDIDPNPSSWLMFTYGTVFLTILEWDRNATIQMLILPIACAGGSIFVVCVCLKRKTLKWPEDGEDRVAFCTDLVLTAMYLVSWLLVALGLLGEDLRKVAALMFLIGANTTEVTSFAPLIRGAYKNPKKENSAPWLAWASAYIALTVCTILGIQDGNGEIDLLIFPVIGVILHGTIPLIIFLRSSRSSV